jgi:peptidoglycan hydrolase-like protein with peptidoglycan-binding domain
MADEPTLTRGVRGDWVVYVKDLLRYHQVEVEDRDDDMEDDDEYGRRTSRAVRKFQRHHELEVTGKVDEQTWQYLIEPPDPENKPPGAGQDEDDDSEDEDDDNYRARRRQRDESGGEGESEEGESEGRGARQGQGSGDDSGAVTSAEGWLSGIADQLGIEVQWGPKIGIAGEPWIDTRELKWLVKNSGDQATDYFGVWLQVVDTTNNGEVMLYKEFQTGGSLDPGKSVEESLSLEDLNLLAKDNYRQFSEFNRYRLDVHVGLDGNYEEKVDLEFEVAMVEQPEGEEDQVDYREVDHFRQP